MGSALKTGKSRTRLFPVSLSRFAFPFRYIDQRMEECYNVYIEKMP